MYSSEQSNNSQAFLWGQPQPKQHSKPSTIFCNGSPTKQRHWRASRETHRNMAEFWSVCTRELLESLPPDCTVIRGCIKFPNRSGIEWKQFKRRFSNLISRAAKTMGCQVAVCAKQHITHKGTDFHFDYIGWTNASKPAKIQSLIRKSAKSAGGSATCRIVDNIIKCSAYVYKFASDRSKHNENYWKFHYLPATSFPVTWVLGNFWRRKPTQVSYKRYWDGVLEEKTTKMNGQQQIWREYLVRLYPNKIPQFTTPEYRAAQKLMAIFPMSAPLPATHSDWLWTLNGATDHPDGVKIAQIWRNRKITDDWLVEAGSSRPSIPERLVGVKPMIQHVVSAGEAIKIRESLRAKPEQKEEADDTQSLLLI